MAQRRANVSTTSSPVLPVKSTRNQTQLASVPSSNQQPFFISHYSGSNLNAANVLTDVPVFPDDSILKSSKNALYITKKEYLKSDWCNTEPLMQRIREPGCLSRNILNRFCYGQCNSFYIPKMPSKRSRNATERARTSTDLEPEDLTGAAFRSCAFCQPKKFVWFVVTLKCPSLVPPMRRKRIQRIKQCKCLTEGSH